MSRPRPSLGPDMADLDASGIEVKRPNTAQGTDSFPIPDVAHLRKAIKAYGRAKDKDKIKAHIISRAKALGATAELPDDWKGAPAGDERKGVPARAYVLTGRDRALVEAIERKIYSPDPHLRVVRSYWSRGGGASLWDGLGELHDRLSDSGVPGPFVRPLARHIYREAKGYWPGEAPLAPGYEVKSLVRFADSEDPPTLDELAALYADDLDAEDLWDPEADEWREEAMLDDDEWDPEPDPFEQELADDAGLDYDVHRVGEHDGPGWAVGGDSGEGGGEKGFWLDRFEVKVMSPNPNAAKLREYWAHGEGRRKWNSFRSLRRHLAKYVKSPKILNGLTANIYKLATGTWPGRRGGEKAAPVHDEEKVLISPEMVAQMRSLHDDDAGPADDDEDALDRYAAMADDISAEDAYGEAIASEVSWQLDGFGNLVAISPSASATVQRDTSQLSLVDGPPPWASSRHAALL